jgi:tetratricopeptide (TPR) repeat protein
LQRKSNHQFQTEKIPDGRIFWVSPLNYYILASAVSLGSFFLIWGGLHGSEEEMPWITAGIAASLILGVSVFFREYVLRKTYEKRLLAQKRLDYNLKNVYKLNHINATSGRLTLERNAQVLKEIEQKSNAAKSFGKLSAPHLEVFEICEAYLQKSTRELGGITKSSPRFVALSRGQERVTELRRFHLLSWASLESQNFIQNSKVQTSVNEKLENANRALEVLGTAIHFYPDEQTLHESVEAVRDFIVSIRVSHWIEQAERAAFKEDYKRAVNHYRDALFFLARETVHTPERELMAEKINLEIEKLRERSKKEIKK